MADRKRKCPFCGSEVFTRKRIEDVEITDDGGTLTDIPINIYPQDEYECGKCGKDLTNEELD